MPSTAVPVTTAEPVISTRTQESQPKLTITRPDLPPITYELKQEYTHAGRAPGNEIPLPYPSVSNRHCIFILSGPEIVLRDLNSSNGTLVNGEAISEVILRPGDVIQMGTVQIKFEPGVKRPKLLAPEKPMIRQESGQLKTQAAGGALYFQTIKIPKPSARPGQGGKVKDDSVYVKGESAISYHDLPKPEPRKKTSILMIVGSARGPRDPRRGLLLFLLPAPRGALVLAAAVRVDDCAILGSTPLLISPIG